VPAHGSGSNREFTEDDVVGVAAISWLVLSGVTPATAACIAGGSYNDGPVSISVDMDAVRSHVRMALANLAA
jgi:hypothetical protein